MTNPRITVSIINYRTAELTLNCIESVLTDLAGGPGWPAIDGRIIVIDNLSEDGSAEAIADWISKRQDAPVELVRSKTNTGFSGGHNQGIGACEAEFTLVLNSDAVLRPGCIAALLTAANTYPKVGILGSRLEDDDGTPQISCFRFPGPMSELIRGANTGPVTALLKDHDVPLGINPKSSDIEWVSFASVLLRRKMFEEIGPMDEGYFLYFEDAEYCLRASKAGWDVAYAPQARTVHFRGGSAPVKARAKQLKRIPAYYYASRARFMYQAYGHLGLLGANLLWILGLAIRQLRLIFGRPAAPIIEKELYDIWTNFTQPLGPRRAPWEAPEEAKSGGSV